MKEKKKWCVSAIIGLLRYSFLLLSPIWPTEVIFHLPINDSVIIWVLLVMTHCTSFCTHLHVHVAHHSITVMQIKQGVCWGYHQSWFSTRLIKQVSLKCKSYKAGGRSWRCPTQGSWLYENHFGICLKANPVASLRSVVSMKTSSLVSV